METLAFIAAIIGHVAWPVSVGMIFLNLRRPLPALFPLIQQMRFQGIELDFSRQVQALTVEARGKLPPMRGVLDGEETLRERWMELAQFSPRVVILEAWLQLEKAAIEYPDLTAQLTTYLRKT